MPAFAHTLRRALPRLPSLSRLLAASLGLARSRARLATLDDHLLADIGLTREKALAEADRPVWDAPDHWIRR